MVGAETILRTLIGSGVNVCFANPGTSEMELVAAFDRVPGMHTVLGLFEGVVAGAADGYARMADKPAATVFHLGPGLTNGLANLHNAKRAGSPVVNLVGDHASFHAMYESPLASDVAAYAQPLSGWVRRNAHGRSLGHDTRDAIRAAWSVPGQISTLIVPADCSWNQGGEPGAPVAARLQQPPSPELIDTAARALHNNERCLFLLDGPVLRERGLQAAGRLANHTTATFRSVTLPGRIERGEGLPEIARFPRHPKEALEFTAGFDHLFLVGTTPPVAFFAYPETPSWFTPEPCALHTLSSPDEDGVTALEALSDTLGAPAFKADNAAWPRPVVESGALTPNSIASVVASLLPENAIISEEAVTSRGNLLDISAGGPRHDWLSLTGGALGQGLPCALGAAIACPERPVLCLQADGAGMYNPQSLWSMAREGLNVTIVIYANRRYRILRNEFERLQLGQVGETAEQLMSIDQPGLKWTQLANGMGVPATQVENTGQFMKALSAGLEEPGPYLVEAVM